MKHIKEYIMVLSASFVLGSCTDRFFELTPSNEISVETFYKTADDFNQAVVACYSKLQGQVSYYTEFCEFRSDNLFISAPTTSTQDRYDIDRFVETSANGLLEDYWATFNNNIYRCNTVLDRIDEAKIDTSLINQYKGEALFVRAYCYFNMYRVWGEVPVTRTVVSPKEALKIGRCTKEEMYQYLYEDLTLAAKLLPKSYSGDDVGRATSGAALTLLGKVCLTFKEWEDARDALKQVIGQYSLTSNPGDVFKVSNKQNSEIIFSIRYNKTIDGEGHGLWHSTLTPNDDNSHSDEMKNCYTADDKRKELVSWVLIEGTSTYIMKKFYDTQDPTTLYVGNDWILLRYADALLMYAEALNEIGYDNSASSEALAALNEVHLRAGLTAVKIADVPDQNAFRNALLLERQKEFPLEGHRWFDLVRMGGAIKAMEKVGLSIHEYQFVFPIPQTELERINNTHLLWQNPGY